MSLSSSIPDADILRQMAERSLSAFFVFDFPSRRFDYLNDAFLRSGPSTRRASMTNCWPW